MPTWEEADRRLAVSLSGVGQAPPWSGGVRGALDWIAEVGARGVVIDAAASETRPRALDRSARRDLAASIRRRGLACLGVDLWIPPDHLISPVHLDRAISAIEGAAGLASELCEGAGRVVSIASDPRTDIEVLQAIGAVAEQAGVLVADHGAVVQRPATVGGLAEGLDCAEAILAGRDPSAELAQRGARIASIRLGDAGSTGRVCVGRGRLDVVALAAIAGTLWREGPIVVDLRGLVSPGEAARSAVEAWESAKS